MQPKQICRQVVMVHGIFNSGAIFNRMKNIFTANGLNCFVPELKPSDARYGLDDLANKLKNEIDIKLGNNSEFILVAFSMGGIVARYYLQNLGGLKRVKQFFTISAPHHGSYLGYFYPGKGAKQLRPGSDFINKLNAGESVFNSMEVYSYWTPFDLSIIPSTSSLWKVAENKMYYSLLHPLMVYNRRLIKDIITEIEK